MGQSTQNPSGLGLIGFRPMLGSPHGTLIQVNPGPLHFTLQTNTSNTALLMRRGNIETKLRHIWVSMYHETIGIEIVTAS